LRNVTVQRSAAWLATVEAIKAMQLPAAMSYGPLAAGAWTVIQLVNAIWRGLLSAPVAGSDYEQLDLVAVYPRGDLRQVRGFCLEPVVEHLARPAEGGLVAGAVELPAGVVRL
jgi:hypothetical protein